MTLAQQCVRTLHLLTAQAEGYCRGLKNGTQAAASESVLEDLKSRLQILARLKQEPIGGSSFASLGRGAGGSSSSSSTSSSSSSGPSAAGEGPAVAANLRQAIVQVDNMKAAPAMVSKSKAGKRIEETQRGLNVLRERGKSSKSIALAGFLAVLSPLSYNVQYADELLKDESPTCVCELPRSPYFEADDPIVSSSRAAASESGSAVAAAVIASAAAPSSSAASMTMHLPAAAGSRRGPQGSTTVGSKRKRQEDDDEGNDGEWLTSPDNCHDKFAFYHYRR
jgi:hypothetical protein